MLIKESQADRTQLQESLRTTGGWTRMPVEKAAELEELLGTINHEGFPGAIVPRFLEGVMVYYAVTETSEQWRNLQPLLRAFVGWTLTDFAGQPIQPDGADPFEALLLDTRFDTVARFQARRDKEMGRKTLDALQLMVRTINRGLRPQRTVPPATAAVLYEFRMALAVGDRAKADQAIAFLRSNLRLDALNLHFLEVQRDAEFGEWEALRKHSFFKSLVETRRPPKVTSALAEALYRTELAVFEESDDPQGALEHFRSGVLPEFGALFTHCPPSPRPAVAKLFMLVALASESPDRQLLGTLAEQATHFPTGEGAFAARIAGLLPPAKVAQPTLALPGGAFYVQQLALARDPKVPATAEGARAVLFAAYNVQSLEAYQIASAYISRLSAAEKQAVTEAAVYETMWRQISQFAGHKGVPRNWQEWAESLSELSFSEARAFAEQAVDEWPIAEHLHSPEEVKGLADALGMAWGEAAERLTDSLPHLVTWVMNDEHWPNPDYRTLYDEVLNMLLLSSNRSGAVLTAIAILLDGRLSLGMEPKEYGQLFEELRTLVMDSASAHTVDWMLDLAELTVGHPCPDQGARVALWSVTAERLGLLRHKMSRAQLGVGADIAVSLGMPETFPLPSAASAQEQPEGSDVDGVVAIYTLADGVAERAQRILAPLYPNLRFELFHDHVATPRLQQYAKTADLFVVCWMAAKHAATMDIKAKRPANLATVMAQGSGSSSVVDAVRKHFVGKLGAKSA